MEVNREAVEAVTTAYSKYWKNQYTCINLNNIIIHMIVVVEAVTGKDRENKMRECTPRTPVQVNKNASELSEEALLEIKCYLKLVFHQTQNQLLLDQ